MTQGCFHYGVVHFRFAGGAEPKVEVWRLDPNLRDDPPDRRRWSRGTLALSLDEVAGLDRLLQVYRTPSMVYCTTHHDVTFVQVRDGKIVAAEGYKHHGPLREDKDVPEWDQFSEAIGPAQP
jgi:hypothetical protein